MNVLDTALHLLQSRQKYFSLPQPFYNSAKVFELDLAGIFYAHWLFAGMSSEIATPGSYLTFNIGRTSIVVLRDHRGDIRAFFNTCRHRGSRFASRNTGSCANTSSARPTNGRMTYQASFFVRAGCTPISTPTPKGTLSSPCMHGTWED